MKGTSELAPLQLTFFWFLQNDKIVLMFLYLTTAEYASQGHCGTHSM